jgi:hypothetical protein
MGALSFMGCSSDPDDTGNLVGKWVNVYDPGGPNQFVTTIYISGGAVMYEGNYEAVIVNAPDFEAPHGFLIIQFTKYATNYDNNPVSTHANVGKYSALYWKDLTVSSVFLADAYSGIDHAIKNTLGEAYAAFTNDTAGTFVDWSQTSPYNKL